MTYVNPTSPIRAARLSSQTRKNGNSAMYRFSIVVRLEKLLPINIKLNIYVYKIISDYYDEVSTNMPWLRVDLTSAQNEPERTGTAFRFVVLTFVPVPVG